LLKKFFLLVRRNYWTEEIALNKIIVRKFREKDAEDVADIFTQVGLINNQDKRKRALESLRRTAKEPEWYDHYLVAEMNERVVGRVILEAAYPPYSELINLYVHSDYQGQGVGSSLVQKCIEIASSKKCFIMSVMADPVGNLPSHRLYSKFSFKPAILGDPAIERGHTWLFRFSENSCISEFLKRHPFAESSVSESKVIFHERMLYRMSLRDPQTKEKIELYLEGQPSQTSEGTMPRISGFSCKEMGLEAIVKEESKTITKGGKTKFEVSIWNISLKPLKIALQVSIPEGTLLNPPIEHALPIEIGSANERDIIFEFAWPSSCKLPDFTSFSTIPVTVFFVIEGFTHPLIVSAGFDKA